MAKRRGWYAAALTAALVALGGWDRDVAARETSTVSEPEAVACVASPSYRTAYFTLPPAGGVSVKEKVPSALTLVAGTNDIIAAREHCLPAPYKAAAEGLPTLTDSGYQGSGIGIHHPFKKPQGSSHLHLHADTHVQRELSLPAPDTEMGPTA